MSKKNKNKRNKKPSLVKKKKSSGLLGVRLNPNAGIVSVTYDDAINEAVQHAGAGNPGLASFIFKQLIEQSPNVSSAYIGLLDVHISNQDLAPVRPLVRSMTKRFVNNAEARQAVARACYWLNDLDSALAHIKAVISITPDSAMSYAFLGKLSVAAGDADSASAAYEKSLSLDSTPGNISAYQGLARIQKGKMDEALIERIEHYIDSKQYQGFVLSNLHFSAAWGIGIGQPERYFEHLSTANKIVNDMHPWSWQDSYIQMQRIAAYVNKKLVSESQPLGITGVKPILIAGPPRSGTTLLEQILAAHSLTHAVGESNIAMQAIKWLSFKTGHSFDQWRWQGGDAFGGYIKLIDQNFRANDYFKVCNGKRLVDKSIDNYQFLGMLLLTYPDARVVHMKRDPMDVVFSCYQQMFESGFNLLFDVERIARLWVMHEKQMDHWKELFPDKIITISYEDLVSDQDSQTRRLLEFCDLNWEESCLNFHLGTGLIKTSSDSQVREKLNTKAIGKWREFSDHLEPARKIIEDYLESL